MRKQNSGIQLSSFV